MDKYTVDLDQVLNDFEYSELTTDTTTQLGPGQGPRPLSQSEIKQKRHPNNVGGPTTGPLVVQLQQQNPFKNTNVKHSINNVFHSLNEYLNSDITPKCEVVASLEKTNLKPIQVDSTPTITEKQAAPILELPINDLDSAKCTTADEIETSHMLIESSVKLDQAKEEKKVSVPDGQQDDIINSKSITVATEDNEGKTDLLGTVQEEDINSGSSSIETIDDKESDDIEIIVQQNLMQDRAKDMKHQIIKEEPALQEIGKCSEEGQPQKNDEQSEEDVGVQQIEKLIDSGKEIPKDPVVSSEASKVDDTPVIGFNEDINLDDSELNKYLDELEKEFEEVESPQKPDDDNNTGQIVPLKPLVEENVVDNSCKNPDKNSNNLISLANGKFNIDTDSISSSHTTQPSAAGVGVDLDKANIPEREPVSIKTGTNCPVANDDLKCDKNDNFEGNLSDIGDRNQGDELSSAIKEGPTSSVTKDVAEVPQDVAKVPSKDVITANEEVTTNVIKEDVVEDTTSTVEKEVEGNNNVSFRPKDLALTTPATSIEGEDVTKEIIDLVGDPGSTPYNNVYVNKELPNHPNKRVKHNKSVPPEVAERGEMSDTECSTASASSPTFSDDVSSSEASGTTGSSCTLSTDMMNDDESSMTVVKTTIQQTESAGLPSSDGATILPLNSNSNNNNNPPATNGNDPNSRDITSNKGNNPNSEDIIATESMIERDSSSEIFHDALENVVQRQESDFNNTRSDGNNKSTEADVIGGGEASTSTGGGRGDASEVSEGAAGGASTVAAEGNQGVAGNNNKGSWLGKQAPLWIPDSDALNCQHCDAKFTVIKRRHHCRACGLVLCSKCCGLKYRLEYMEDVARVCNKCYDILSREDASNSNLETAVGNNGGGSSGSSTQNSPNRIATMVGNTAGGQPAQPNPNNPAEYCSTVPPHQQVSGNTTPPSVLVPVGVLKRKGSNKSKSGKSVMFCDGIRPGSDLTSLDNDFGYSGGSGGNANAQTAQQPSSPQKLLQNQSQKLTTTKDHQQQPQMKKSTEEGCVVNKSNESNAPSNRSYPLVDSETRSFVPSKEEGLPPIVTINKTDVTYTECMNGLDLMETLRKEKLTFGLQLNLYVHVKIINMDCCINKTAWCFSTEGLINVGQDEIVIILELLDDEKTLPKDMFLYINNIYEDAVKGTSVREMGLSLHTSSNFLGSKNHAGFVFIRPTFQCLQNVIKPAEPYLIGLLIHRWETPWAKLFPLRLVLRLGAEYRYYPSPIISNRYRDSVFVEIGHTIINLLADFRNFSYTLPQIRGLTIHMEDKNTTVTIPVNRYDQTMKSMNNSSDHILAFAGNFSSQADSHLVCIQDTQSNENAYSTHAINIHNKPRKVTGASFIVFNGALKTSSGLTAKSSIVEDGLMIQIPAEQMVQIRESLRNMKDHVIRCGCVPQPVNNNNNNNNNNNSGTIPLPRLSPTPEETVKIVWGEADVNFNINVVSPIDNQSMAGVPSIRVHNGKDYICNSGNRLIRWTEVFIIQNNEESCRNQDPVDISKVSESISKATCNALVKYLDLLVSNNFYKIGIRTTLHVENVSYSAGSNGMKLPPIYMKSLDNELIPVLHRITSNNFSENAVVLELIFRILNK